MAYSSRTGGTDAREGRGRGRGRGRRAKTCSGIGGRDRLDKDIERGDDPVSHIVKR